MVATKKSLKDTLAEAYAAWSGGVAYIDNNGNYHIKDIPGRVKGRIAPWNRTIKKRFRDNTHFHRAAQLYKETGIIYVPVYFCEENVRIFRLGAIYWTEIERYKHWYEVEGWVERALVDTLKHDFGAHPFFRNLSGPKAKEFEGPGKERYDE